ncbi:enoyl-CoA hydratase/isomerase family protein [Antarcticimicrobium sediminis]|uniref:3-hydroxyisobutyryl-CoA hydrolase n=1 Tax=Antarcticimicrobium sediminis TaxID=2546227 RepID=A0A4R5EZN8_9RHOB|nr:enoyl-CoA hydratase/isomerase family protein [Antarcticimicrobium sediminis]TDE40297.1 enoyl-CoA hydratase/isomerase family protein [Antarcticimicrobium sediminis]
MADIATHVDGRLGRINLIRPEAMNAFTHDMCLSVTRALERFLSDPDVAVVVIEAAGEQAFSAGADMRMLYRAGRAGSFHAGQQFWRDEYRMDAMLATYPKPVISLMQGFTMGGGVGLGCHVSHRIVSESACLGMPDCCIGRVPDAGATRILSEAPGGLGRYLALTGYRLGPADAIYAGFADHQVPRAQWPDLLAALAASGEVGQIAEFATAPGPSRLASARNVVDQCFAEGSLSEIIARLQQTDDALAVSALARITKSSPLALACALELQARYTGSGIHEALAAEYRFTFRSYENTDFLEGLRAIIIEKDLAAKWRHPSLSEPSAEDVAAVLAPLGDAELQFERGDLGK